jgi:uncharacterized protein YbjT (DUF2867 family)
MRQQDFKSTGRILLTGATGYVGGRLLTELEAKGETVRCLARQPEFLREKAASETEVVRGDVLDFESLSRAMIDVEVAVYLVHSLGSTAGFESKEREGAETFVLAARNSGVKRIVYLGGLGSGNLSPHLRSRQEVGRVLRESGIPTVEFQASIVIGSGSFSFEMIRALVNKLPVMVAPKWVNSLCQPIAVEDLIQYLQEGMVCPLKESCVVEIGGPDRVSYLEIMKEYSRQRGLRRLIIPVPVLTPRLSSLWLGLVTPVYARVGRKLVDSLQNDTVVEDEAPARSFSVEPRSLEEAIRRAQLNEDREFAETRWSDSLSSKGGSQSWGGVRFGTRLVDSRTALVRAERAQAFEVIERIGGETGWYYANWLWRSRGFLDLIVGGVGLRRGRRDPHRLRVGDSVDFWRVESIKRGSHLLLAAEMKLPGRAWLQFELAQQDGQISVRQTALFDPVGLLGLTYWYSLYPLHRIVFRGMLRGICSKTREERLVAEAGAGTA